MKFSNVMRIDYNFDMELLDRIEYKIQKTRQMLKSPINNKRLKKKKNKKYLTVNHFNYLK